MLHRLTRLTRPTLRLAMSSMGSSSTNACSSAAAPYPLVAFHPSSTIPRLPLLAPGTAESDLFAEKSRDGSLLRKSKDLFRQSRPVVAISVPARESSALQNSTPLKTSLLRIPKFRSLLPDPSDASRRLLQLNMQSLKDLPDEARHFIEEKQLSTTTSEVVVDYDYWTVDDVLSSLLPEGLPEGTPTAFTTTGHIAHVNLRDEYAAYRYLIAQVILEKNSQIRTVVNKLDTIDNEFRFFKMERLAGDDEYEVTVSESGCTFTFDFRTVYWNSRLHTEHDRLVTSFQPYEVVSDVMAGVGPFAVPAAKKGVYVLANDLNPSSYESLTLNTRKNKVESKLRCYCEDGRHFIRESIRRCWEQPWDGVPTTEEGRLLDLAVKTSRGRGKQQHQKAQGVEQAPIERGPPRRLINRFVMNLPGTALEFLDAFPGAYKSIAGEELEREMQRKGSQWPMVHVHCFTKDIEHPHKDICQRANERLGLSASSGLVPPPSPDLSGLASSASLPSPPTPDLSLHFVRSVAPNKDMYCLSFRLTRDILLA